MPAAVPAVAAGHGGAAGPGAWRQPLLGAAATTVLARTLTRTGQEFIPAAFRTSAPAPVQTFTRSLSVRAPLTVLRLPAVLTPLLARGPGQPIQLQQKAADDSRLLDRLDEYAAAACVSVKDGGSG